LKKIFGSLDYLDYSPAIAYPIVGEFSMRKDVLHDLRNSSDWGLEIGVLSEQSYRNYSY